MSKRVVYIAGCIPTLTCTFVQREIFDLQAMGFQIDTVSMNSPLPGTISRDAHSLMASMLFLDRVSETKKVFAFLRSFISHPRALMRCARMFFSAKPMRSARDYARLGYHLIESCYLAAVFAANKPDHIHSHFVNGPTSLAMFLSELIQVPFSFTMHASLIWLDPLALHTKLRQCTFCVSISEFNRQHVLKTYDRTLETKVKVIHCGVQIPANLIDTTRNAERDLVSILAVGQLKRRKGFHVLVEAANILKARGARLRWTIVGEGDQRPRLEQMIRQYGLQNDVVLAGAKLHEEIPSFLDNADIFTLPCVIGDDNTRDGIPVALMEAMARRLPVVSTNIVGLPELIRSEHDGILVEPDDPAALADAIGRLAKSADLRRQLGLAGSAKIDREFNSLR